MGIPFTQYLLPDGRKRDTDIERPAEIEEMALRFMEGGGRYECEILTTGEVSLTAVKEIDGEPQDVEIEVCHNGPGVGERVDDLVRRSIAHVV